MASGAVILLLSFIALQFFVDGIPADTVAAGLAGVMAVLVAGGPWRGLAGGLLAVAAGTVLSVLCAWDSFGRAIGWGALQPPQARR